MTVSINGTNGITFNNNSTQSKGGVAAASQVWNNVTSSRALSITYTNSNTYPIMVNVCVNGAGNLTVQGQMQVSGVTVAYGLQSVGGNQGTTTYIPLSAIVPSGATYIVTGTNISIYAWAELY